MELMKHFDKILLLVLVLVIVGVRLDYYWDRIEARSGTLDLPSNKVLVLETRENNIWKLDLTISGEIRGSGNLSIGDSDSTSYRTYELDSGHVDIEYEGDWYSQFCYITFIPKTPASGKLMINGDFIGD